MFNCEILSVIDKARGEISSILSKVPLATLPSIALNSLEACDGLPAIPCIYFLTHPLHGLLYVGKAKNLLARWRSKDPMQEERSAKHHHHLRCIEIGDVSLSWLAIDLSAQLIAEAIAIEILDPAWNRQNTKSIKVSCVPEAKPARSVGVCLRGRELMKMLVRKCRGTGACLLKREDAANELGISERRASDLFAELSRAGLIEIQRGNRMNRYWIPPRRSRQKADAS